MKKTISILLALILISSSLFAVSGNINFTAGFSFVSTKTENFLDPTQPAVKANVLAVPINIEGVTYFTNSFGLAYGVQIMNFPISAKSNGNTYNATLEDFGFPLYPYVQLAFKHNFDQKQALGFNAGIQYEWMSEKANNVSMTANMILIRGDVSYNRKIGNSVNFKAGATLAFPVSTWITAKADGMQEKLTLKVSGIELTPFIGIGFAY